MNRMSIGLLRLTLCSLLLGDRVCLVDRCLDDLLLFRSEVLGQTLVHLGLLLLQTCTTVSLLAFKCKNWELTEQCRFEHPVRLHLVKGSL